MLNAGRRLLQALSLFKIGMVAVLALERQGVIIPIRVGSDKKTATHMGRNS